jgi:hypothetical protein
MPQVLKSDPANGVTVMGRSVFYSLNSTHWQNLTQHNASATYSYTPPIPANGNVEMATMNMAKFGTDNKFYSAKLRLGVALGFGQYEQSIKVGKGSGICTAFYLSQYDKDQIQEIDFEMAGHCDPNQKPCGTQSALTCVWSTRTQGTQYYIADTKLMGRQHAADPDARHDQRVGHQRVSLHDRLGARYYNVVGRSHRERQQLCHDPHPADGGNRPLQRIAVLRIHQLLGILLSPQ